MSKIWLLLIEHWNAFHASVLHYKQTQLFAKAPFVRCTLFAPNFVHSSTPPNVVALVKEAGPKEQKKPISERYLNWSLDLWLKPSNKLVGWKNEKETTILREFLFKCSHNNFYFPANITVYAVQDSIVDCTISWVILGFIESRIPASSKINIDYQRSCSYRQLEIEKLPSESTITQKPKTIHSGSLKEISSARSGFLGSTTGVFR